MFQSLNKLHGSLLDCLQYVHFLTVLGRPGLGKALQVQTLRAEQRKRIPSLYLLGKALPNALQDWPIWQKKLYISMPSSETLYPTLHQVNQKFKPAGSEAKLFL